MTTENRDTSAPKRSRGRPAKVDATDVGSIVDKIKEQEQRFTAKCADSLQDLFAVIFDIGIGKTPSSIKDQVGAAKYCIEKATKFLERQEESGYTGKSETEKNDEKSFRPLVSVTAREK